MFRRPFLGTSEDDVLVREETDPQFFIGISCLSSNRFMAVTSSDHETSEVYLLDCSAITSAPQLVHARTTYAISLLKPLPPHPNPHPSPPHLSLSPCSGVLFSIDHSGSNFYIHTNADGAINFQVLCSPAEHLLQPELWRVVAPHSPDIFIEEMRVTAACVAPFLLFPVVTFSAGISCFSKKSMR